MFSKSSLNPKIYSKSKNAIWSKLARATYTFWCKTAQSRRYVATHCISFSTNRQLTKPTEKLPALAGMAQIIHSLTGDTFLAGFWRKDLLISLRWSSTPFMFKEALYSVIEPHMEEPQWEYKEPLLEGPS